VIRIVLVVVGLVSLALGAIGIFLPLLPTVPFLLLSAICFANASERLHGWLLSHRVFGPPIQNWNERGAISRRAKWIASISIVASFALAILFGFGPLVLGIQGLSLIGVAIFVWTRPNS
jgi:uncharacterized membrane protein YbaN (DUF454 family)